jgi:hypothetical protein
MDDDTYLKLPSRAALIQRYSGLGRLLCAAQADPVFAAQLLIDPLTTLNQPALPVELSAAERALALPVTDATDIHDFAAQLHASIERVHSYLS